MILSLLPLGSGCTEAPVSQVEDYCLCATGWTCDESIKECVRIDEPYDVDGSAVARGDGGSTSGKTDAGKLEAGNPDAGDLDAGNLDAGNLDAGDLDAGDPDAGNLDAGNLDAGDLDAGDLDAGDPDAGDPDAGDPDAGVGPPPAQCTARTSEGHLYWFCSIALNWQAASLTCTSGGLSLVRVDSLAENDFVRAGTVELLGGLEIWLGGSDAAEQDVWRWSDGAVFFRGKATGAAENNLYTKWATSQPSGAAGEDCTELRTGNRWNDVSCDLLRQFVCER